MWFCFALGFPEGLDPRAVKHEHILTQHTLGLLWVDPFLANHGVLRLSLLRVSHRPKEAGIITLEIRITRLREAKRHIQQW